MAKLVSTERLGNIRSAGGPCGVDFEAKMAFPEAAGPASHGRLISGLELGAGCQNEEVGWGWAGGASIRLGQLRCPQDA